MAKIEIKRGHNLGKEAARKSAEHIGARLSSELQVGNQWHGDTLKLSHPSTNGSIMVSENVVEVRVELSFLLRPFRSKIEQAIHEQLEKHL